MTGLSIIGAGESNAGIGEGLSLDELLKACQAVLSERWHSCKKCGWFWKRYRTARVRAQIRLGIRGGRVKGDPRPKKCPNCMQINWWKGYAVQGAGHRAAHARTERHSKDLLKKRMRVALMEHALRMKERSEDRIENAVVELLKRLG